MLQPRDWIVSRICAALMVLSFPAFPVAGAQAPPINGSRVQRLDEIAARLAAGLSIRQPIRVAIVPHNDLVISAEPLPDGDGYRILMDSKFLEQINDQEIVAALAHELGHVWIYSHHPYLQTEALANEIAMRIVSRDQLQALYASLWAYTGVAGNIDDLLGTPRPSSPLAAGDADALTVHVRDSH